MIKKVAAYLGETGQCVSLQDKGRVVIYEKNQGQWEVIEEVSFSWEKGGNLREMRKKVEEMIESLGDCRIFVALSVSGVPYHALEKAQFQVWECEGQPQEFLDDILAQEEEARLAAAETGPEEIPAPTDLGNGVYTISLKEIQQKNSQFTSKQVLLPFLRQGQFYSLEIICNHLPKWLELELLSNKFTSQVEQIKPGELKVVLGKKVCF